MMGKVQHTFNPFYDRNSKILILGSMPSVKSRELGFYYMHPQNRFWQVLQIVFNDKIKDNTIESKKEFLIKHKIALWDVIKSCEITSSSDASIKKVIPNNIKKLLKKTKIKKIYTTGKKAYDLYNKYIFSKTNVNATSLYSTSPANCAIKLEKLVENYQVINNKNF